MYLVFNTWYEGNAAKIKTTLSDWTEIYAWYIPSTCIVAYLPAHNNSSHK